jgi:long-subunit fatty acid transport protein
LRLLVARCTLRAVRRVVLLSVLLWGARAAAWPFLAPRPVPNAIAGPTDPHVAAAFYNPAALGPLTGIHLHIEGGARLQLGNIERDGGRGSQEIVQAHPDSFMGLSWNVAPFTIALAVYTPQTDLTRYSLDSPVRFFATEHTMMVFQQTAGVAARISGRFFVGVSANFGEVWLQHRFARDAALDGGSAGVDQPGGLCGGVPCGDENPQATQRVRARGFDWGVGFSVGALVRPVDRLWIGLSYTSEIFGLNLTDNFRARVQPAPGQAVCGGLCVGNSAIPAIVPDMIQLGLRVEASPTIDVEAQARWIHYGARENEDIYLQGGDIPESGVPPQITLGRGWRDTWMAGASVRFQIGDKLKLSPSVIFETGAMNAGLANAASLDAPKIDIALTAAIRPTNHLFLGAHIGGTAYVLGRAGETFDPRAQTRCVDSRYDLDVCAAATRGEGLPSAAGQYSLFVLHVGAAIGFDY